MRTASPDLGLIDAELRISALFLEGARRKYRADPSPENRARIERARAEVDRLLDRRLAARERPRPAGPIDPT